MMYCSAFYSKFVLLGVCGLLMCQVFNKALVRSSGIDHAGVEWMKPGSKLKFDSKEVPHVGLLNRLHWVEKNERSTSRDYTLWDDADIYLLEWPGNITTFDQEKPLVKWGRQRAKYIEDECGLEHNGIEMRAYAYKYVYLTWGPNRLTSTYTAPLTVPRSILPFRTLAKLSRNYSYDANVLNVLVVFDIAFVFDALLLAYSEGVLKVSGLEMAWAPPSGIPMRPLKYSLSRGITAGVDKLVVQNCCLKSEICPFGNYVVSYREFSYPHSIYVSSDSGETFKYLERMLPEAGYLRAVLSYPEFNQMLIFHGNSTSVRSDSIILSSHQRCQRIQTKKEPLFTFLADESFQGSRLGMDASFLVWDTCNVWYSPYIGLNVTKALFYLHKKIIKSPLHHIVSEYCRFGKASALAYGKTGKFGLLDRDNVFFLGIDTKSNLSQLVALKMDMTLMKPNTRFSIFPFFDILEQPKLLYPPKYLDLPKKFQLGKRYERRLGMRLLPKNVYPSDFILSFYEENAYLTEGDNAFALKPCQTSSLKVNNSITQRRKLYHVSLSTNLNFTITIKSNLNKLKQVYYEPHSVRKYLHVTVRPISIDMVEHEKPKYWIKYRVNIQSRRSSSVGKIFRITFYTKNELRCNHLPRVPVYVKVVENNSSALSTSSDQDMSKSVYLKSVTGGETQYLNHGQENKGETFKVDTCPFSKSG